MQFLPDMAAFMPGWPISVNAATRAADLVLVPCRPAILDLEAVASTLDLVRTTGKPVAVVLNAVGPQGGEAAEASEAVSALGERVFPVRLVNRVAFSRALISGQAAQELQPRGKAASEIEQLHACICAHMNACT